MLPIALALSLAAAPADTSVFAVLRGSDTLVTERFTRDPSAIEGEMTTKGGAVRYTLALAPDGRVTRMEAFAGPGGAVHAVTRFVGDSAISEGSASAPHVAVPAGTVPFLNLSSAFVELIVTRARAAGGDSAQVPLLINGMSVVPATVTGTRGRDVRLAIAGVTLQMMMDAGGRMEGACVPMQGVSFVRIRPVPTRAVGCAAAPHAAADYSAPAGAPYRAEDVRIATPGGWTLAGTLTLPANAHGRVPAVVTISGSGPQDRDSGIEPVPGYRFFRQIADTLGRRGIAVLRLDDRGVGASGGDRSKATSADFADDVRAALAWLRARPEIDPRRIALAGHSEGGLIAPMIAAGDTSLKAIVLMAGPSWTGRRVSTYQNEQIMAQAHFTRQQVDSALALLPAKLDTAAAQQPWLRFFFDYDPLPTIRRVRVPVLILQGGSDHQVDPRQADELAAALRAAGNRAVTEHVFPDLDHLFLHDPEGTADVSHYASLPSKQVPAEVLGMLADWLAATLR
jgi:fermentation-respiration switch protein FrsA (DUF1100 family)